MAARDVPPIRIPDDFTVWAMTDVHGQLAATDELLAGAGIAMDGRWIAPARTALVVTGDVVDRGPDSVGLVRRLASLRVQAAAARGMVALVEGNHEAQVLGGLGGEPEIHRALMAFGGGATLLSAGLQPDEWADRPAAEVLARVDELAPDFVPTLWSFAPYARWRDTLFVHGGPVPHQPLDRFERSAERLWIRDAFFASPDPFPHAEPWAPYREDGIERVVFGHTQTDRPTAWHEGRALNLDTGKATRVTLARIAPGGDLGSSGIRQADAAPRRIGNSPLSPGSIRHFDSELPGVVDAWMETRPWEAMRRGHPPG